MTSPAPTRVEPVLVLREDREGVARLTLNRPQQYNALSKAMLEALQRTLDEVGGDTSVRIVVIGGAGKAFCAGHDLKEMRANRDKAFIKALFDRCARLMLSIRRLPQPVIARVHGIATAAGCQLVATCDLALAAEEARFATPGVKIGLFCSTPMVALSRAVGRKQAMAMLLTGEFIDARTARERGLVNRVVPLDLLEAEVEKLARSILTKSPAAVAGGKRMFYEQIEKDLEAAYAYASEVMACDMLADDAAEGIDAFIEKRPPKWKGR